MPEYDVMGNPKVSIDDIKIGTATNIIIKEPLDAINFEIRKATLECVGKELADDFEYLWNHSRYDSETLYKVFMSHGSEARKIIETAIKDNLASWWLLFTSDKILDMKANESLNKLKKFNSDDTRHGNKEKKLPKKLRKGW